jgi:subtilisin family serine protease
MKKWCLVFFSVVLSVMNFLPAASTFASETKRVNVIILFKKHVDEKAVEQLQGKVYQRFEVLPALSANVPLASVDILRQLSEVEYVQQDETVTIDKQVTDWGVTKTKATNMHVRGVTGKGVKIAILDTGIDTKHPDLHVSGGACLLSDCSNSYNDDNGHGTHVAGIIAAQNNHIGVLGVAPEASIYAVKVLNRYGDGTLSTVLAGIEWAIQHNMDIINLSLATSEDSPVLKQAIDKAYQQGLLIVAAVGNNGNKQGTGNTVEYPAKYDSVIAVSAINRQNVRADYSATGSEVEVAAPGEEIYSTVPVAYDSDGDSDGYTWMSGTSMAAPFVSGILALYKQQYPNKTNVELRQMLRENAVDLGAPGKDDWYGYGLVQAEQIKPPQLEVKLQSNTAGVVNFSVTPLTDSIQGYNVYRDGKQIKKLQTSSSFTDYVLKGSYRYQFSSVYSDGTESALSNPITVTLSEPDYKDLTNDIWYTPHIVYLFSRGIVTGYNNGTVKPNDFVTRAEAVAMLGRALHLDSTKRSTVFKDVDSANMASGYIQSAYERGWVNGFPDGTFRPQQPITRAETAMLLAKAYQLPSASSMTFKDVTDKVTGHAEIYKIAAANITKGYPDGTFRPYQSVKRLEFFVFIARAENDIFK